MSGREQYRARRFNDEAWRQLAGGRGQVGGGRGGGGAKVAMPTPPRDPSLTEKFNRAAKDPHLKVVNPKMSSTIQVELLKKKLSQPRMNCSYSPMGTVTNSFNPKGNRNIMATIKAMEAAMKAKQGVNNSFSRAAKVGTLTHKFNQASFGRKR